MRPAALGLLAALLVAPLAAQAAQQPARFAVTLQGRIVDNVTYERIGIPVGEDCTASGPGPVIAPAPRCAACGPVPQRPERDPVPPPGWTLTSRRLP